MVTIPSSVDSTTIAKVVLSHSFTIALSTMAFVLMYYGYVHTMTPTIGADGVVSYMNEVYLTPFVPPTTTNVWTILLLGCGGAFPLIHTSHAIHQPRAFGRQTSRNADSHMSCTEQTTLRSIGYRNQMEVTHMVLQMLGRRRRRHPTQPQPASNMSEVDKENENTSAVTVSVPSTTASSIIILSIINSMTSISSELIYRLYLPTLLFSTTSDTMVSLLIPALLYGVSHTPTIWDQNLSVPTRSIVANTDSYMLLLHQTMAALWYSILYMCSGSIVPGIISHYMYDMDVLTSTWHTMNDQMDYIDDNHYHSATTTTITAVSPPPSSVIGGTTTYMTSSNELRWQPPLLQLTSEAEEISRRFFLAFDSEHVNSWSVSDLDRALQYILYNTNNKSNRNRRDNISAIGLFRQYATTTISTIPSSSSSSSSTATSRNEPRLQYTDYLQLLQNLYTGTNVQKRLK